MTVANLVEIFESTGLPCVYMFWQEKQAPQLPYLVYYFPSSNDDYADNINYRKRNNCNLELYTKNKDFDTEVMIENVLNNNGLTYSKSESYISSEKMYEVLYEMEVVIDG